MKLDILAIGAHPDDVELSCAGTLAKEISKGKKVGILDITQGELGTRGTAATREKEAKNAAEILGIKIRENLKLADGFFQKNEASIKKIVEVIRKYQPEVVLCNAPIDRHPDHGKAADLVKEACFLSGLIKVDTGQAAWRPKKVFHYIQWQLIEPDFIVDVSGFLDIKLKACLAYETQFYQAQTNEPDTPISSKNFLDSITYRARDLGRLIGTEAGEGFIAAQPLAVDGLDGFL